TITGKVYAAIPRSICSFITQRLLLSSDMPVKPLTWLLTALFLLMTGFSVRALPAITYHTGDGRVDIGKHLEILEDPEGAMSLEDVMASERFAHVNQQVINLGVSNSTFWIRFTVANQTDHK